MLGTFEYYTDTAGLWCWRRRSEDGNAIDASEKGYVYMRECTLDAARVAAKDKWRFFEAVDGWRWHVTARNGSVVGFSPTGFKTVVACQNDAREHGYYGL